MNDAASRIMKARSSLILTNPFFGALTLRLKIIEDPKRVKKLATDGKSVIYNPEYINTLTDAELKGKLCEVTMHNALGHPWRRDARDLKLWNRAADAVTHPILKGSGFTLTKDIKVRADMEGKSAEEAYAILLREDPPGGGGGKGQGGGSGQQPPQGGQGGQGEGDGEGEGEVHEDDGLDAGAVLSPQAESPSEAKAQETEWRVAATQAAQMAKLQGKLPAGLERMIEENNRNKVDWKSVLRRFMTQIQKTDYSWRRPKSRYAAMGLYLPEAYNEAMPPVVIAVDTSGSIGQAELDLFGAEINAVVKEARPEKTYIVYCDATVNRVDEFLPDEEIKLTPCGGGGTSFKPPFAWAEKHDVDPACLIYLTDMYGDFPEAPGTRRCGAPRPRTWRPPSARCCTSEMIGSSGKRSTQHPGWQHPGIYSHAIRRHKMNTRNICRSLHHFARTRKLLSEDQPDLAPSNKFLRETIAEYIEDRCNKSKPIHQRGYDGTDWRRKSLVSMVFERAGVERGDKLTRMTRKHFRRFQWTRDIEFLLDRAASKLGMLPMAHWDARATEISNSLSWNIRSAFTNCASPIFGYQRIDAEFGGWSDDSCSFHRVGNAIVLKPNKRIALEEWCPGGKRFATDHKKAFWMDAQKLSDDVWYVAYLTGYRKGARLMKGALVDDEVVPGYEEHEIMDNIQQIREQAAVIKTTRILRG